MIKTQPPERPESSSPPEEEECASHACFVLIVKE